MIILCFADMVYVICQPLAACVKATCCGKMTVLVIALPATFSVSVSNMKGVAAGWLYLIGQVS